MKQAKANVSMMATEQTRQTKKVKLYSNQAKSSVKRKKAALYCRYCDYWDSRTETLQKCPLSINSVTKREKENLVIYCL